MQTVRLRALALEDGMRVLDLGCGAGRHVHAVYYDPSAQTHVVGVDLAFADVVKVREGFEAAPDLDPASRRAFSLGCADATRLPFADATFDVVICSEVLEHIPAYPAALDEIARILKPAGRLAVSVPRFWTERICWQLDERYHRAPGGHVRIFRWRALAREIERRGFRLTQRHGAHALHTPYWWMNCLWWDRRDEHPLIKLWHRLLVWDILQRPRLTRWLEAAMNPVLAKSEVLYFTRRA